MKRGICLLIALSIMLTLSLSTQPVQSQSESGEVTRDTLFVPGHVIVGFDESVAVKGVPAQAAALAGEVQAAVLKVSGSTALLEFAPDADVQALAENLQSMDNVTYAEQNAIFWLPELAEMEHDTNNDFIIRQTKDGQETIVPISILQSMKKRTGGTIKAVYPNDPYLWANNGWGSTGAGIVFTNTTPSKNVCVIDTGVDHTHPDLLYRVILGKDFVNNDNGPMDDNGHGTHVAGIISAKQNNKQGMAGVSTGKVIAVKSLGSQGYGTSYDVSQGIYYCANRSDVGVINMSLGGTDFSQTIYNAVNYAVNGKMKLIVAAAGNSGSDAYSYPAAFSVSFPDKVLSVAASGAYSAVDWDEDGLPDYWYIDNWCKADYSNYGSWVDIIGPGTDIFSTVPWNKPYYMSQGWYSNGYTYLSGTSMAAPFVSAVAARAWGYKPGFTNEQVSQYIKDWGEPIDEGCWPETNWNTRRVNVAAALQRGAVGAAVFDANTGLPLPGANVSIQQNGISRGSGLISSSSFTSGSTTYTYYSANTDIINLPVSTKTNDYQAKVNKSGYTATPQAAFINWSSNTGAFEVYPGYFSFAGEAFVPPKSTNFNGVYHTMDWMNNTDLFTFLPNLPKPSDDGQPAPFAVNITNGWSAGFWEQESTGNLAVFPFARQMMEGSWMGYGWDSTIIRSKPGKPAVPYYQGDYTFAVWNPNYIDSTSFFLWKDGVIKKRVDRNCSDLWWRPLTLSQKNGVAVYTEENYCGSWDILPYPIPGFSP